MTLITRVYLENSITIDGPTGVLNGSDVAATAIEAYKCNVYCQDSQGVIREYAHSHGLWTATISSTFRAKMFSPLAAVNFNGGKEIRVYCVSEDDYLEEWCYSSGLNGWSPGYLTKSKFRVDANTKLAAVCWLDNGQPNIRVYAQEPCSNQIQEYVNGNPWKKGAVLPAAHTGTGLASICWLNDGIHIRVYYQAPDMTLREYCCDGGWFAGEFRTEGMPPCTSIAAAGWFNSISRLRVYCQDARKNIVAHKSDDGWKSDGIIIGPLRCKRFSAAIEWNTQGELRLYYQGDDNRIYEHCKSGDNAWLKGFSFGS
ncbi:fucose-specific lectin [Annulohypoxylon truncatum]|uniref:fucose-specific lectin n=1 Tax=Annulohypoxylon truncatum TaxID=327061 RepID=UPI002008EB62|nr:fucose-specific lectin [Annulohypoxylon truncatum]KAI1214245.1 fucose-specific lectin [Annulohypoxylon truncatum]